MIHESGNISVHTENIFPIIKKWLYSDRDIFVRELVSNGCDAISKLKRLSAIGEAKIDDTSFEVKVVIDVEKKSLQFIDNGIGMTADEVKKYINQVAFSSAEDFIEKFKEQGEEDNDIIGHFGLGFYSAFMVAKKVEIETLSYQEGADAVKWVCEGGTEYEMDVSERKERGTTITLYIDEENKDFLETFTVRQVLDKYCSFLPVDIYLEDTEDNSVENKEEKTEGEGEGNTETNEPKPINDSNPLWLKKPSECTEEEYKEFYKKVFNDFNDPLFWIHLNVDYPFNLKGILYFPKLKHEFESSEGQIKLFSNQVFVADNVKEVIPEFLMLLKGTIDCPDLPLNVSRSFLQNDGYVTKVSKHITKKVGDKLVSLFNVKREDYNSYWDDIHPFIKYGCMRNEKFYEKVKDIIIYKTTLDEYVTLKDYLEKNKEKHENKVFYVTDELQQAQYIKLFKEQGMEAIILPTNIDSPFIQFLETKETEVKFNRIDSDISENLKDTTNKENDENDKASQESLEKIFKGVLNNEQLKIQVENLVAADIPAMILLSEQSRRMQEMSQMYGGMSMPNLFPEEQTLVLNKNNQLIQTVINMHEIEDKKQDVDMICEHVYDLAMMSHKQLEAEAMTRFVERSHQILSRLAESK